MPREVLRPVPPHGESQPSPEKPRLKLVTGGGEGDFSELEQDFFERGEQGEADEWDKEQRLLLSTVQTIFSQGDLIRKNIKELEINGLEAKARKFAGELNKLENKAGELLTDIGRQKNRSKEWALHSRWEELTKSMDVLKSEVDKTAGKSVVKEIKMREARVDLRPAPEGGQLEASLNVQTVEDRLEDLQGRVAYLTDVLESATWHFGSLRAKDPERQRQLNKIQEVSRRLILIREHIGQISVEPKSRARVMLKNQEQALKEVEQNMRDFIELFHRMEEENKKGAAFLERMKQRKEPSAGLEELQDAPGVPVEDVMSEEWVQGSDEAGGGGGSEGGGGGDKWEGELAKKLFSETNLKGMREVLENELKGATVEKQTMLERDIEFLEMLEEKEEKGEKVDVRTSSMFSALTPAVRDRVQSILFPPEESEAEPYESVEVKGAHVKEPPSIPEAMAGGRAERVESSDGAADKSEIVAMGKEIEIRLSRAEGLKKELAAVFEDAVNVTDPQSLEIIDRLIAQSRDTQSELEEVMDILLEASVGLRHNHMIEADRIREVDERLSSVEQEIVELRQDMKGTPEIVDTDREEKEREVQELIEGVIRLCDDEGQAPETASMALDLLSRGEAGLDNLAHNIREGYTVSGEDTRRAVSALKKSQLDFVYEELPGVLRAPAFISRMKKGYREKEGGVVELEADYAGPYELARDGKPPEMTGRDRTEEEIKRAAETKTSVDEIINWLESGNHDVQEERQWFSPQGKIYKPGKILESLKSVRDWRDGVEKGDEHSARQFLSYLDNLPDFAGIKMKVADEQSGLLADEVRRAKEIIAEERAGGGVLRKIGRWGRKAVGVAALLFGGLTAHEAVKGPSEPVKRSFVAESAPEDEADTSVDDGLVSLAHDAVLLGEDTPKPDKRQPAIIAQVSGDERAQREREAIDQKAREAAWRQSGAGAFEGAKGAAKEDLKKETTEPELGRIKSPEKGKRDNVIRALRRKYEGDEKKVRAAYGNLLRQSIKEVKESARKRDWIVANYVEAGKEALNYVLPGDVVDGPNGVTLERRRESKIGLEKHLLSKGAISKPL